MGSYVFLTGSYGPLNISLLLSAKKAVSGSAGVFLPYLWDHTFLQEVLVRFGAER